MRHGQRASLQTYTLTPYTRRGWSVVKGRSDIYTRPLYIPSEVTWFHGEIPRLWTLLSFFFLSSFPFFSFLSSLSFYLPFVLFLSVSASPLLSILFSLFYFSLLALYHSISPFRIVQFISILFRCSLFVRFTSGIISSFSWTRIMSAWLLRDLFVFQRTIAWQPIAPFPLLVSRSKQGPHEWNFMLGTFVKMRQRPGWTFMDYGNAR